LQDSLTENLITWQNFIARCVR